jgi:AraC family transcriptional regulator
MQISKAFETLFGTLYSRALAKPDMRMIGVYLEDPDIVPSEELRSIACVTIDSAIVSEPPLEPRTLDGGEYGATPHGAICRNTQSLPVAVCGMASKVRPATARQRDV